MVGGIDIAQWNGDRKKRVLYTKARNAKETRSLSIPCNSLHRCLNFSGVEISENYGLLYTKLRDLGICRNVFTLGLNHTRDYLWGRKFLCEKQRHRVFELQDFSQWAKRAKIDLKRILFRSKRRSFHHIFLNLGKKRSWSFFIQTWTCFLSLKQF